MCVYGLRLFITRKNAVISTKQVLLQSRLMGHNDDEQTAISIRNLTFREKLTSNFL